jgi:hypothetical protein
MIAVYVDQTGRPSWTLKISESTLPVCDSEYVVWKGRGEPDYLTDCTPT